MDLAIRAGDRDGFSRMSKMMLQAVRGPRRSNSPAIKAKVAVTAHKPVQTMVS